MFPIDYNKKMTWTAISPVFELDMKKRRQEEMPPDEFFASIKNPHVRAHQWPCHDYAAKWDVTASLHPDNPQLAHHQRERARALKRCAYVLVQPNWEPTIAEAMYADQIHNMQGINNDAWRSSRHADWRELLLFGEQKASRLLRKIGASRVYSLDSMRHGMNIMGLYEQVTIPELEYNLERKRPLPTLGGKIISFEPHCWNVPTHRAAYLIRLF